MSPPLRHCSECHPAIWISQGGHPSSDRMSTALSIHYWLPGAVTWLPQHPTQPSMGVMADGREPRPQTQSHCPKGPSCKSGHTLESNLEDGCNRRMRPSAWPTGPASLAHHPHVPHCGTALGVPQHLLTQTRVGWEGRVKRSPLL